MRTQKWDIRNKSTRLCPIFLDTWNEKKSIKINQRKANRK